MKYDYDLGFELYIPSNGCPNFSLVEHCESSRVLKFLKQHNLERRVEIFRLNDIEEHLEFFEIIKDPDEEVRLPFLSVFYGCMSSTFLGYIGYEEIISQLKYHVK